MRGTRERDAWEVEIACRRRRGGNNAAQTGSIWRRDWSLEEHRGEADDQVAQTSGAGCRVIARDLRTGIG
jgi:hypothetical protein